MRVNELRKNLRAAAFGAGIVVMLLAVVWLSVAGAAQESTDTVPVCVGADRVLRFVEVEKSCKAGERRFVLASATVGSKSDEPEAKKPSPKKPAQPSEQNSPGGGGRAMKVTAPFEVVDKQGRTIMKVQEPSSDAGRGMYIYNDQGLIAASITVLHGSSGGRAVVYDGAGSPSRHVQMLYGKSGPQFVIKGDNEKMMLSADKSGLIYYNAQENPALFLGAGTHNQGVLKILDSDGTSVVEASSLIDKRGVVRVYPAKGTIPFPIPQFLIGSKP